MAFDGVFLSGIISELKNRLLGGRIYKIYQPEPDELSLVIKKKTLDGNTTNRLLISAGAGLPLMYLTENVKENPVAAPNFCMLLRKYIGNGRIVDIRQPEFERIAEFTIEHLDEMGDVCTKKIIVEIMGKHSNIIFTDSEGIIIDSIKHISYQISSVREVLPGRTYTYPPGQDKVNPLKTDVNYFINHILAKPESVAKAIYTSVTGISPVVANEIAVRADVDGTVSTSALTMEDKERLYREFSGIMDDINNERYIPNIAYEGYEPKEFSAILLTGYGREKDSSLIPAKGVTGLKLFVSPSAVLEEYYSKKSVIIRMKQRSVDLRKIVSNTVERTGKKYDLQLAQLKDTEKREKYRIYGELITTYGYSAKQGDSELICENYYTGETVNIPLENDISPMDNAKKYFAKYNKLKRTHDALIGLTKETEDELNYLLSVQNSLNIVTTDTDLEQIKSELTENGYIRGRADKKGNKKSAKSKPLHYISSDGFHIYVGKNNYQNEDITFKMAEGSDMWFHAKNMPGSHVVVKTEGADMLPDNTYEEAARLAAYYSSGKDAMKVEIDYTLRKNLKKPPKAKTGFVIYHTNYSMTIEPDINGIREVAD